ncbi:hypothetical protein FRB90_007122 [Tulasnella sp. 427]|nr:hypothetical protein FRB90_007122 [Tulasnella sp. 427]
MSSSAPETLKAFTKLKETLSGEASTASRAGGSSSTDGGVVLHLNKFMNGARCDPEKRLLYVDGGATWEIVDKVGMEHGLATVAGNVNHTGVGGLALGGGYGWLTGRHGMTVDNMVQVTVVLASGEIVTANEKEHPDLFWGCRGAGCNFGVVTEFVFKAHPQRPTVFVAKLIFTIDKLEALVKVNEEWSKSCGPDEGLHWACVRVLPGLERGKPAVLLTYVYNGDSLEGRRLAQRWYDLGPTKEKALEDLPYVKLNTLQNEANRHGGRRYIKGIKSRSAVSAETIRTVLEAQDEVVQANPGLTHCGLVFEASPKRKAAAVSVEATAYAGRGTGAEGIIFSFYSDPSLDETARNNARKWAQLVVDRALDASATGQETEPIGVSYANLDPDAAKTDASTIFGRNYDRLRKVKKIPVTVVTSTNLTCNAGVSSAPGIAWVKAGSTIGFALDTPIFHPGPINVYMAKAPSGKTAAAFTGTGQVWFKVAQLGAITDGGTSIKWPADNLASYNFTIPAKLASGDYLVRIEHIALHTASTFGEAQFYISCAQVHVFGTGTSSPTTSSLVSIPGVYTGNELGLLINIWWPIPTTYVQPGPAVWS